MAEYPPIGVATVHEVGPDAYACGCFVSHSDREPSKLHACEHHANYVLRHVPYRDESGNVTRTISNWPCPQDAGDVWAEAEHQGPFPSTLHQRPSQAEQDEAWRQLKASLPPKA